MLQLIRGTVGTWIVKALFFLLIGSFAIWGIGDIFRGKGPATTVAEIGPIKIPAAELDREFRQQLNRLRPMFGGQLDMEQARQLGLVDQTLDQLIQRTLFDLAAQDSGLAAGDEMVKRRLQRIPAFRNELGQFEPELLRRALSANGMSENTLIGMIREESGRQLVVGAINAGAQAPDTMVDALYRFRNEKRSAETLTLANDKMPEPPTPDEAELTRAHEDKAVRYTAPEYRGLTIGLVSVDELAKTLDVTEDEIKAAYDSRADEFQTPEKRGFQQALVDNEDQARRIVEKARASGGDLTAAAKAEGVEATSLGPLGETDVPEIGASVFALEADTVADPFKSDLGWHVIKVTKIEPAQTRKLAEVHDEVAAQVRKDRASDQMPRFVNMIDDALAGGSSLEEVAAKYKLRLVKIDSVDATGLQPDGSKAKDVPDLTQILQTAFNLAQGARSSVIEAADSNAFVVRADSMTPAHLKPLAEVRDQVIAGWKADQRAKATAERAQEIENQLKAGTAIEAVATATGAVVATTEPLARDPGRGDAKLPPDLLKALFTLEPGQVAKAATANGQVIARLKVIIPADPKAAPALVAGLRDSARQDVGNDLLAEFVEGLRNHYQVRVNHERIQQMFSSN